jgi:uncharacterized protein HemX
MSNAKKILIAIIAALALFGGGLLTGSQIRQASDNKRINQLENTNKQEVAARERAERTTAEIRNAYTELDNNSKQRQRELEQAQALNRKLVSGAGKAEATTEEILKRVDSIIEKVKRLGEPE